MPISGQASRISIATLLLAAFFATEQALPSHAQSPEPAAHSEPNSDPSYLQLRGIGLSSEAFTMNRVALVRDAATFHLNSGTVCFLPPVQGKVTGAVFVGDGTMTLDPPTEDEHPSLKLLTKSDEFAETFTHLVLRFTDSTYDELKQAGTPVQGHCDEGLLRDSQNVMRHKLKYNLDGRILQDVVRSDPGGLFVAFIHGQNYDGKEVFFIDPNGAIDIAPGQVEFMIYGENHFGIWTAFPFSNGTQARLGARAANTAKIHVESQELNTTIENNACLTGKTKTTFVPLSGGSSVFPFDLFSTLRVQSVLGPDGQPLSFIQEDKNGDSSFYVIFSKPLTNHQSPFTNHASLPHPRTGPFFQKYSPITCTFFFELFLADFSPLDKIMLGKCRHTPKFEPVAADRETRERRSRSSLARVSELDF